MIVIDKLSYSSRYREKNATVKTVFSCTTLLILVISHSIMASLLSFCLMGSLTVFGSKTSLRYYCKILMIPAAFLLLSSLTIMISITTKEGMEGSIRIFSYYIMITKSAYFLAIRMFFVAMGSVSCLYFLILTTPMIDLLQVLKKARVPAILLELMMLMYRLIFVILDMVSVISVAQKCRLSDCNYATKVKSMAAMLSSVFIKSFQNSRKMYDAMESRGYDGTFRVLQESKPVDYRDVGLVIAYEIMLCVIVSIENGRM